ncbi:MAG: hypothetical protein COB53_10120 [Elusimicrobia bacterium]|nr:MAG: hypothetical protein COB53_10120 [Elusimicrobiota bacterium]
MKHISLLLAALLFGCSDKTETKAAAKPLKALPGLSEVPLAKTRLSVQEAYEAIPHRRTRADVEDEGLDPRDELYLKLVFSAIDESVALRVSTQIDFIDGDTDGNGYFEAQDRISEFLEELAPPPKLVGYHGMVLAAISDQRAFFAEWRDAGAGFTHKRNVGTHAKVQSASGKLRSAYGTLIKEYPPLSSQNKEAYFDYHCALDFI